MAVRFVIGIILRSVLVGTLLLNKCFYGSTSAWLSPPPPVSSSLSSSENLSSLRCRHRPFYFYSSTCCMQQRHQLWAKSNKKQDNDRTSSIKEDEQRIKRKIRLESGREANMISRTVPITTNWTITVWEWENPATVIESYWDAHTRLLGSLGSFGAGGGGGGPGTSTNPNNSGGGRGNRLLDPFGLVMWPGAVVAAQEIQRFQHFVENQTVLVLGAGVGVEAQASAMMGAKQVIATDIHPTTLKLLEYGVQQEITIPDDVMEARVLDLFSPEDYPLPFCDVLIAADILYNDQLASQVTRRCAEALINNPQLKILITDSQRFVDHFATELNDRLQPILLRMAQQDSTTGMTDNLPQIEWEERTLDNFRGSGVAIDEDQTYDVNARVIQIGFRK